MTPCDDFDVDFPKMMSHIIDFPAIVYDMDFELHDDGKIDIKLYIDYNLATP